MALIELCDELQHGDSPGSALVDDIMDRAIRLGVYLRREEEYTSDPDYLEALSPVVMAASGAKYYLRIIRELHLIHPLRLALIHKECSDVVDLLAETCDMLKARMR